MMKSVAIVGAGPGGLVAAKMLIRLYPQRFNVTIFDKQDRVGGLWAVDIGENDKTLSPHMPTNLSKYNVSYSDLSWSSVDLSDPSLQHNGTASAKPIAPMFPEAWQVGRYLAAYARRYIPDTAFRLRAKVTHLSELPSDKDPKWHLRWTETKGSTQEEKEGVFDYTLVATGFLSSPLASSLLEDTREHNGRSKLNVKHSSRVRTLSDLVPEDWSGHEDILVIGGTMSGVEAAASLALQISDRRYRPGGAAFGDAKVIHVTPRPFYAVPRYIPLDPDVERPTFLPLDLCFYTFSRRPAEKRRAVFGRLPPDRAEMTHWFLRSKVGGDQSDLNAPALVTSSVHEPAYIGIGTGASYSDFVRDGHIVPVSGRVKRLAHDSGINGASKHYQPLTATISNGKEEFERENLIGAIRATGYTPQIGIEFISDEVKAKLEHDPANHRVPLILTGVNTMTENIPHLAFVGLHEGTYWAVAEYQARMIASKWANEDLSQPNHDDLENERAKLRDLRQSIHTRESDVPQLWNNDYVGLMEQGVDDGYSARNDVGWDGRSGPVYPSRYTDNSCDNDEAEVTRKEIQAMMYKASSEGLFVAHAAFTALQGSWKINREIKSALPTSPSGKFVGVASFEPRNVTDPKFDAEHLYVENGDFITDQGFTMRGTRRYVYRYKADEDAISAWFVKDDAKTVDYHFLDLTLQNNNPEAAPLKGWVLEGHHPCAPDTYYAQYAFQFRGCALKSFDIQYNVTGPKKDYVSKATYQR